MFFCVLKRLLHEGESLSKFRAWKLKHSKLICGILTPLSLAALYKTNSFSVTRQGLSEILSSLLRRRADSNEDYTWSLALLCEFFFFCFFFSSVHANLISCSLECDQQVCLWEPVTEVLTTSYWMKMDKLLFRAGLKKVLGIFKLVHDWIIADLTRWLRGVYCSWCVGERVSSAVISFFGYLCDLACSSGCNNGLIGTSVNC